MCGGHICRRIWNWISQTPYEMVTEDYSSPTQPSTISSDWDQPFTDQDLQAIEAAFQSATSSSSSSSSQIRSRRRGNSNDGSRAKSRRRLPDSIFGLQQPTDNVSNSFSLLPCRTNRFYNLRHSSRPEKLMTRYPMLTFGGHIVYSRTVSEVEKAAEELLKFVEAKKKEVGRAILGLDIEWKPTFRRGAPAGKAAVMQICGDTSQCHVMHIIHSGIPQNLLSLLGDPTTVKVGVRIANDAVKVFKDHNVSIEALEDLAVLANQKLGRDPKNRSLGSLTELLICKQLPKPAKIRLGNWEAAVLSQEQLQYAATDAFASWYLYEALKTLPDAADNESKEMDSVVHK